MITSRRIVNITRTWTYIYFSDLRCISESSCQVKVVTWFSARIKCTREIKIVDSCIILTVFFPCANDDPTKITFHMNLKNKDLGICRRWIALQSAYKIPPTKKNVHLKFLIKKILKERSSQVTIRTIYHSTDKINLAQREKKRSIKLCKVNKQDEQHTNDDSFNFRRNYITIRSLLWCN